MQVYTFIWAIQMVSACILHNLSLNLRIYIIEIKYLVLVVTNQLKGLTLCFLHGVKKLKEEFIDKLYV